MNDEAGTHRLGRGSVGDVVFSGGQRQGRLIELHEDREERYNSAAFGLVYLATANKKHSVTAPSWNLNKHITRIIIAIMK